MSSTLALDEPFQFWEGNDFNEFLGDLDCFLDPTTLESSQEWVDTNSSDSSEISSNGNSNDAVTKSAASYRTEVNYAITKRTNSTSNQRRTINVPMPIRVDTSFELGLADAFNCGDLSKLSDLVRNHVSNQAIVQFKDDRSYYKTSGSIKIIRYFSAVIKAFPDAILFIKRMTPGRMHGLQTRRTKLYFTGTNIDGKNRCPVTGRIFSKAESQKLLAVKAIITTCFDENNKIIVFDDRVSSMSKDCPLDMRVLYPFLEKR